MKCVCEDRNFNPQVPECCDVMCGTHGVVVHVGDIELWLWWLCVDISMCESVWSALNWGSCDGESMYVELWSGILVSVWWVMCGGCGSERVMRMAICLQERWGGVVTGWWHGMDRENTFVCHVWDIFKGLYNRRSEEWCMWVAGVWDHGSCSVILVSVTYLV